MPKVTKVILELKELFKDIQVVLVHKDLQDTVEPQVKSQVPWELKVPKVLKELKDRNRRFRDILGQRDPKVLKD